MKFHISAKIDLGLPDHATVHLDGECGDSPSAHNEYSRALAMIREQGTTITNDGHQQTLSELRVGFERAAGLDALDPAFSPSAPCDCGLANQQCTDASFYCQQAQAHTNVATEPTGINPTPSEKPNAPFVDMDIDYVVGSLNWCRQQAAQAWCTESTSNRLFDHELAEAFAQKLWLARFEIYKQLPNDTSPTHTDADPTENLIAAIQERDHMSADRKVKYLREQLEEARFNYNQCVNIIEDQKKQLARFDELAQRHGHVDVSGGVSVYGIIEQWLDTFAGMGNTINQLTAQLNERDTEYRNVSAGLQNLHAQKCNIERVLEDTRQMYRKQERTYAKVSKAYDKVVGKLARKRGKYNRLVQDHDAANQSIAAFVAEIEKVRKERDEAEKSNKHLREAMAANQRALNMPTEMPDLG